MARRRFFVNAIRGGIAQLSGDDARHLTRVLRAEAGQQYEICDNRAAYLAEIAETGPGRVVFRVIEPLASPSVPVVLTVGAALVKFDRFEWMIEKCTELGVARILPFEAVRTEKGLLEGSRKRSERWARIARESSEQSRRTRLPDILPAVRFEAALSETAEVRLFLDEDAAPPIWRELPETRTPGTRATVLVGPEGGWTENERRAALAAGWSAVSLGPHVLRAETAAAAAAAILVNAWMV
jgi:16S rRNA (uracil1498-N3)-methyltransferase